MKLKRYFILALLLIITVSAQSQKIKNKQFTLTSYDLQISKEITEELSGLESFIDKIKTYNDPGNDKIRAIFEHIIYFTLRDKFREELEIEILPINTFMRKVKYDDYGYPKATIREALRKGDSKYYFKVDAKIESLTEKKREESPELFEEFNETVIFPQLTLEITVWNNQGIIPVDKWIGVTTSKYPLPLNNYLLKGFDNSIMTIEPAENQQQDNFFLMLDRAIHNAIQDYYTK